MTSSSALKGKNIYVTRPAHQAASFAEKITRAGGQATVVPAIKLCLPENNTELEEALKKLSSIDLIIFTSVNGVTAVVNQMNRLEIPLSTLSDCTVAAIGPATAAALDTQAGCTPDIIPDEYISDALPERLGDVSGKTILLPRADIARKNLANVLRESGANVLDVAAYTVTSNDDDELVRQLSNTAETAKPDYLTATSSSTVRGLKALLTKAEKAHWLKEVPLFCIGPITADTAKECGVEKCFVAKEYTTDGLLEAILDWERTHD